MKIDRLKTIGFMVDAPPPISPNGFARAPPLIVSIEGNIGVGKSTVIDRLQELFKDNKRVAVLKEPVSEWEEHGFLQAMYEGAVDPASFQHMVLMSLAGDLLHKLHERDHVLIITERSAKGNFHTFGKANLEEGTVGQKMYKFTYDRVLSGFMPTMKQTFVYLKASAKTAKERMRARGREAEKDVDDGYLIKLGDLHDEWLANEGDVTTVYVDNMNKDEVFQQVKMHMGIALNNYISHEKLLSPKQHTSVVEALASLAYN